MTPELTPTTDAEKSLRDWLGRCDDPAQELVEWRDLQNAQATSLMHVWDNPEDECWNNPDIPGWDGNLLSPNR